LVGWNVFAGPEIFVIDILVILVVDHFFVLLFSFGFIAGLWLNSFVRLSIFVFLRPGHSSKHADKQDHQQKSVHSGSSFKTAYTIFGPQAGGIVA
jgi:hypothetical protein